LRADLEYGRLPAARVLELGILLTEALAHLHGNGLVHRDIKPSNIIFVGGKPKLADIGLVTDASDTCSIVGTEGYLPPEGPGTPQGDLFALGKVLYEAATGLDRRQFPQLAPDLRTWPDAPLVFELNEILLRACAPDSHDRYGSAEAMRADLEGLAGGKSVRRAHQVERRWRTVRRGARWAVFGVFVLTLIALVSRVWQPPANPEFGKRSTNSVANDWYDIGRTHYQKNVRPEIGKAAEYFQAAIKADTNFALAQAALAVTLCWPHVEGNAQWALLPRAKELAERALAKDDALSEAHLAVALHAWIKEWDWRKAEKHYQAAVECDPKNSQPHEWYGMFLRTMGRTNDAIREEETAVNLNPQSQTGARFLGFALFSARRYSEAVGRFEKAVAIDPHVDHMQLLSEALLWDGQIDRSLAMSARAAELDGKDPAKLAAQTTELKRIFHEDGAPAFWRKRLEIVRGETTDPMDLAEACAVAGRTEEALGLLKRAYGEHHVRLVWDLKTDPKWDNLRGHQGFKDLLKNLHLD
jgi:tetratricopeptide (TPR) repeat protein